MIPVVLLLIATGCKNKSPEDNSRLDGGNIAKTAVSVVYPSDTLQLNDTIDLNARSVFLLKYDVKANTTGYILKMNIKLSDHVNCGQPLFILQTKEALALGNTVNSLDPSFHFSGRTAVLSPSSGYVFMLNHLKGDYVREGEILATVADAGSFGFIMELPYEYDRLVGQGDRLTVRLPDGRNLDGYAARMMPSVDPAAQTRQVFIKVKDANDIPENLIASVNLLRKSVKGLCVPVKAVLTDDSQSEFWVMKLINDTTAVKVDIRKGIEYKNMIEIKSGNIMPEDRILVSGNYGMADTAYVKVNP
jgi:multidrug efflux pump subunit AcrA (membrane-fusion protein)